MRSVRSIVAALAGGFLATSPVLAAESKIASPTEGWNHLWNDLLIDLFVIGIVFGLAAIYMLIRYRATRPNQYGDGPILTRGQKVAWVLVPVALLMADDFMLAAKGWSLWNVQRTVPANAMEVKVSAAQWSYDFDYGNGVSADELVVPVGKPVVLRMTATDVIHSFGLNEYRLKEDILPGRVTYLWFYPDKPLKTQVVCVAYCGMGHSQMYTPVRAVPQPEFDAWVAGKSKKKAADIGAAVPARS
jgi:cytochrome c oxidase subunit 2